MPSDQDDHQYTIVPLAGGGRGFFPPAVLLTTLIFATVLAVVQPWVRIRGGRPRFPA